MEYIKELSDISYASKEGQYLMAALAILTTEGERTKKTPFEVLDEIAALRDKMLTKDKILADACQIVFKALREDQSYYWTWKANIAMAFYDNFFWNKNDIITPEVIHDISNKAADYFLKQLTTPLKEAFKNTTGIEGKQGPGPCPAGEPGVEGKDGITETFN